MRIPDRARESAHASAAEDSDSTPEGYFAEVHDSFVAARRRSAEPIDRYFQLGPFVARFSFANPGLVPFITPALSHLEVPPSGDPAITICFFDGRSTGANIHAPRWRDPHTRGTHITFHGDRHFMQYDFITKILLLLDARTKTGIFWIREADQVPTWETGTPLRILIHWWMGESSLQLLHGGAVGDATRGILLVGRGGSGKSSACASILRSRLQFLADDYCLVDTGPSPRVYNLYASLKLQPDMLDRVPFLQPAHYNPGQLGRVKPVFLLNGTFSERITRELPLKAILIPRVTGEAETTLTPATPVQALKAMAPSTVFQLAGLEERAFQRASDLVRRLPCHHLNAGTDLTRIPVAIESLLRQLPA